MFAPRFNLNIIYSSVKHIAVCATSFGRYLASYLGTEDYAKYTSLYASSVKDIAVCAPPLCDVRFVQLFWHQRLCEIHKSV